MAKYTATHGDTYTAYGMQFDVPELVSANLRYLLAKGRPYEAEEAEYIQRTLTPGTNVLELGGSIGVVSRVIRARIGPDARHIVVEANPDLAPVCRNNAARGTAPGVTEVVQGAVAYTDAETVAFSRGITHHSGHLARAEDVDTFDAPALTLKDLSAKLPDGPWALVCDIEGGEYDMFMKEPAASFSGITHGIIEIHPKEFADMGGSESAFLERVTVLGFTVLDRTADVLLLRGPAG
ncbi:MAG: FkbM family methyltransferase [Sulfitobacter sp.]